MIACRYKNEPEQTHLPFSELKASTICQPSLRVDLMTQCSADLENSNKVLLFPNVTDALITGAQLEKTGFSLVINKYSF